ncbi:hypothetical protein HYW74_03485 [Candidatus Pacearchaeota archaeon]|nr:hypothetical protein [Candidatus Pacearchaeota archaeon]
MSEEREIHVASSLITLMDALSEKTREVINSDNEREVVRYEEKIDSLILIAGSLLESPENFKLFDAKYENIKEYMSAYFIERAKRFNTQRASQEA